MAPKNYGLLICFFILRKYNSWCLFDFIVKLFSEISSESDSKILVSLNV